MAMIDRIRRKYIEQNPCCKPDFVKPPAWVEAVAAVMEEVSAENRRAARGNPEEA